MPEFQNVLFLPPVERRFWRIPAGLYTQDGAVIPEGLCWHRTGNAASAPPKSPPRDVTEVLPGRSLFLGAFSHHFGHRLVESTARFHGFADGPFDQVLLFTQHRERYWPVVNAMRQMFALYGLGKPKIVMPDRPVMLESVSIPEQGWGEAELAVGTPDFRSYARAHFARDVAPDGAGKVYISRSRMDVGQGGFIGEKLLEAHLEAAGFRIFHPQEHSLAAQVAQYRAAEVIIGADGTPFHLVALAARETVKTFVIQRRITGHAGYLVAQMKSFGQPDAHLIPCKPMGWAFAGVRRAHRSLWGEVPLSEIRNTLIAAGVLPVSTPAWPDPGPETRASLLADLMAAEDCSLCEVTSDQTPLGAVPKQGPEGRPVLLTLADIAAHCG